MNRFTKLIVLMVLALWGLAAMHCKLESIPGLSFLKICCFVDPAAPAPSSDCGSDGCGDVEDGGYRLEDQTASAPQPLLVLVLFLPAIQPPACVVQPQARTSSLSPAELPRCWQFNLRTALSPRAPSFIA